MIEIDTSIKTNLLSDYFSDHNSQKLTVDIDNDLKVKIVIPNNCYEWYVDIFNQAGEKVFTNWYDHYGDSDQNLKNEMKESIEDFIINILKYPTRVIGASFQIYNDDIWTEIIC